LREREIIAIIEGNPTIDVPLLAERLSIGAPMAYRILGCMKKKGIIERRRSDGRWIINSII
jgi:DNA-binding IclR family transcriptional regulator